MTHFTAFADAYDAPAQRVQTAVQGSVESLAFTHALVALAAQLSAVDGKPQQAEYYAFQSLFVSNEADEVKLRSLFVKHVGGQGGSSRQYAAQVAALTSNQPQLRYDIFLRLVRVATSDGMLNAAEMEWLRVVGASLQLDGETVRRALEQCLTTGVSPYAVLGVQSNVDDGALRTAYMARVQTLHPDRYQAAGASAETIAMLSQQLAAVNAAYDAACKARAKKSALSPTRLWAAKRSKSAKATAA
jgi:DnaJ like chaperone protein